MSHKAIADEHQTKEIEAKGKRQAQNTLDKPHLKKRKATRQQKSIDEEEDIISTGSGQNQVQDQPKERKESSATITEELSTKPSGEHKESSADQNKHERLMKIEDTILQTDEVIEDQAVESEETEEPMDFETILTQIAAITEKTEDCDKTDEEQAQELIEIIMDENRVESIYHPNILKKPLANKLFVKGINLNELIISENPVQRRFSDATESGNRIVFYPTKTTSQIFSFILKSVGVFNYFSAPTGIGKSFSAALFVYLMRLQTNARVLYINDFGLFSKDGFQYLCRELWNGFKPDLISLNYTSKGITELIDKQDATEIRRLFIKLETRFKENKISFYKIGDQANKILNEKEKGTAVYQEVEKLLARLELTESNITTVFFVSATNELITRDNDPNMPIKTIDELKDVPKIAEFKFIKDRFNLNLLDTKDQNILKMIKESLGGHFLTINKFSEKLTDRNNVENSLNYFIRESMEKISQDINKYLRADGISENQETFKHQVVSERQKALGLILHSILNKVSYGGQYHRMYFDQRYFFGKVELKYPKAVNPLVVPSIRRLLQANDLMKQMIEQFRNNPSVLGFFLESIVLSALRDPTKSFTLKSMSKSDDISTTEFVKDENILIITGGNFDLNARGFHIPLISTFAQYDAFVNIEQKVFALQVKIRFNPTQLDELRLVLTETNTAKPGNTKAFVRQRIRQIAETHKKSLNTVLISVDKDLPNKHSNLFSSMKDKIHFYHLDAIEILEDCHFESRYIEIFKNTSNK